MRNNLDNENSTNKKGAVNMFFSGVLILTLANILVKSMGLVSKIVLNTVVGSAGAGYYSSAYEIYAFLYIIATSGLPVALSIMISKCRAQGRLREARKIFNVAMLMFFVIARFKFEFSLKILKFGVVVYTGVLVLMFLKATSLGLNYMLSGGENGLWALLTLALGSLFFLLSDATIGVLMFGGQKKNRPLKIFNIVTYFAGQMLLASSILFIKI
jgi:hypothetical protein